MKKILVIGGGAMGSAFTIPCLDNNNKVIFSGVEIVGDKGELVWVTGLPNKVTIITVGQEFVMENQKVNYTLEES